MESPPDGENGDQQYGSSNNEPQPHSRCSWTKVVRTGSPQVQWAEGTTKYAYCSPVDSSKGSFLEPINSLSCGVHHRRSQAGIRGSTTCNGSEMGATSTTRGRRRTGWSYQLQHCRQQWLPSDGTTTKTTTHFSMTTLLLIPQVHFFLLHGFVSGSFSSQIVN